MNFSTDLTARLPLPVINYKDQIEGLKRGQKLRITVRDHERVRGDSRGKTFDVIFDGINWTGPHGQDVPNAPTVEEPYLAAYVMVRAWGEPTERTPRPYYGFHGWLIEKVEVIDESGDKGPAR